MIEPAKPETTHTKAQIEDAMRRVLDSYNIKLDQPTRDQTTGRPSPVSVIEYLADGCALVRRADETEKLLMQEDVPEFLMAEMRTRRERTYGG